MCDFFRFYGIFKCYYPSKCYVVAFFYAFKRKFRTLWGPHGRKTPWTHLLVSSFLPLMCPQTLSRGTLRSLRAHFVRLPSESKAFFGASVPGLEHTLSPRGVCSRIPHTMSRQCCITYHRKAHIIPFFVTPRLRGLKKFWPPLPPHILASARPPRNRASPYLRTCNYRINFHILHPPRI